MLSRSNYDERKESASMARKITIKPVIEGVDNPRQYELYEAGRCVGCGNKLGLLRKIRSNHVRCADCQQLYESRPRSKPAPVRPTAINGRPVYRPEQQPQRKAVKAGQRIECKHCEGSAICKFSQQEQKCPICSTGETGLASCKVCEGKGYTGA